MRPLLAILLPALVTSASATFIPIDDFSDGDRTIASPIFLWRERDLASVWGGSRVLGVQNLFATGGLRTATVANGKLAFDPANRSSLVELGYGYIGMNGFSPLHSPSTDLNLSGVDAWSIQWGGSSARVDVDIRAESVEYSPVSGWRYGHRSWSYSISAGPARTLVIPASTSVTDPRYRPGAVDYLRMSFRVTQNEPITIDRIDGVPEPASLAVLGAGLGLLRRRKAQKGRPMPPGSGS